jgi:dienelactone hydrolase
MLLCAAAAAADADAAAAGLGRFILYPGTKHGFAVRGSRADSAVNAARDDALRQGLGFFKQHLTGEQPSKTTDDAPSVKPVGVVLTP